MRAVLSLSLSLLFSFSSFPCVFSLLISSSRRIYMRGSLFVSLFLSFPDDMTTLFASTRWPPQLQRLAPLLSPSSLSPFLSPVDTSPRAPVLFHTSPLPAAPCTLAPFIRLCTDSSTSPAEVFASALRGSIQIPSLYLQHHFEKRGLSGLCAPALRRGLQAAPGQASACSIVVSKQICAISLAISQRNLLTHFQFAHFSSFPHPLPPQHAPSSVIVCPLPPAFLTRVAASAS